MRVIFVTVINAMCNRCSSFASLWFDVSTCAMSSKSHSNDLVRLQAVIIVCIYGTVLRYITDDDV